jgi:hypothetical protein
VTPTSSRPRLVLNLDVEHVHLNRALLSSLVVAMSVYKLSVHEMGIVGRGDLHSMCIAAPLISNNCGCLDAESDTQNHRRDV